MKDGEPCTSRGVSTVLEGVTPRPLTKGSRAWRFLPYELYTMDLDIQVSKLQLLKEFAVLGNQYRLHSRLIYENQICQF